MSEDLELTGATAEDDGSGRRAFLSRSGLMLALLAVMGEGTAQAADVPTTPMRAGMLLPAVQQPEVQPLNQVLKSSITAGKLDTSSPGFLKLSPQLRASLQTLTASDLATLRAAQAILASHLRIQDNDNNGTIGM